MPPPPALGLPRLPKDQAVVGPQPISLDEPEPSGEPSAPPLARHNNSMPVDPPPNLAAQPEIPEQRAVPTLDPALASLYEPACSGEDFLAQRRRHDRSETNVLSQVFG